jgi:hypothetical protein
MIKISFFIELCHYKDSRFNKLSVSKTNLIIECNMRKINSLIKYCAKFSGEVNSVETIFNDSVDFYTTTTIIATTGSSGNKATTTPPTYKIIAIFSEIASNANLFILFN